MDKEFGLDVHGFPQEEPAAVISRVATDIVVPRFRLAPNSLVRVKGRQYLVQQRLTDKWWLLDTANGEPLPASDREIADWSEAGDFFVERLAREAISPEPPPQPLLVGENAHKEAVRRMGFVQGCRNHPDFARSAPRLRPIIHKVAIQLNEAPVSVSTILSWIDLYERWGNTFGLAALAPKNHRKGWFGNRLPVYQETAIQAGVEVWLRRNTMANAYATVVQHVWDADATRQVEKDSLPAKYIDDQGRLKPPSPKSFERRCQGVPSYIRDTMRVGARYAKKNGRTFGTCSLPDRVYSDVEVDECTLDILVKHERGVTLGRPNLIAFRDRATSLIIGWDLGFEEPSYPTFLAGLRAATYGPDVPPEVINKPIWMGQIENLYHDNAFHFIGDSIQAAGTRLGINLVRLQPLEPWLKSQMEAFFRKLGIGLVHRLGGTTLGNPILKRDHENLGLPHLTLAQCRKLVAVWICDVYNASPSKTLGLIRGFNSGISPLDAWNTKAKSYEIDGLPRRDVFVALAGVADDVTIQRNGITTDYLIYEGPNLASVIGNPGHHSKGRHGASTHYGVSRDPENLAHIYLKNHHAGTIVEVPICSAHAEYAEGLTLTEHQIIMAHARREAQDNKKLRFAQLVAVKAKLNALAVRMSTGPSRKQAERSLARFLQGDELRLQRSAVATHSSGEDYLDISLPNSSIISQPQNVRRSVIVPHKSNRTEKVADPVATDGDEPDISALRAQKNWS